MLTNKILPFLLLPLCNCFVFSNFQSARLLSKNQTEIQPVATVVDDLTSSSPNRIRIFFAGLQAGYGFSSDFNLRARFLYAHDRWDSSSSYIELEPKFSVIPDHLAFSVPVGYYFSQVVQVMPSYIFTIPLSKRISFTSAPRVLAGFHVPDRFLSSAFISFALVENVSFSFFNSKFRIVPEIGFHTATLADILFSYGIGFSFVR